MNRKTLAGLSVVALCAVTSPAQAQAWLQDRALLEGRGIRAGNFELHPGVGAELGFDSNVFYQANNGAGAIRLRVTPSLYLSTLGPQRSTSSDSGTTALPTLNFRGGVALTYHEWIATDSNRSSAVSGQRNLGAQASLRFDFFPGRTWQFSLGDDFQRIIQPGAEDVSSAPGVAMGERGAFTRNFNTATFEMAYAPGRGVFEWRLGYSFSFNLFDSAQYQQFDYFSHNIHSTMRWRFLPKTALVWEASVVPTNYIHTDASSTTRTTGLFSSTPITSRAGINGLLTERIALMVLVGYTGTFFSAGDNADTIIGQAELRWIFDERSSFKVGFQRDVQPSFYGNYFVRNRGYLALSRSFSGRFLLSLDGGIGLYQYGYLTDTSGAPRRVSGADSSGNFSAVRVDGRVFGEYRFSDVFGLNATLGVAANISDVSLGAMNPIAWTRFEAFLGARFAW